MHRLGAKPLALLVLVLFAGCKEADRPSQADQEATAKQQAAPDAVQATDSREGGAAIAGDASAEGPSVRFERTEFDFGEVEAGREIEHLYSFRNVGKAVLVIEKVGSS